MSNEQLEIIRRRFEALHPVPNGVQWCGDDYDYTHYRYEDAAQEYSNMWRVWISCMSQEIDISPMTDLIDVTVPMEWIANILESQGYKVKKS